mmetsp:Transcript_4767/g.9991  ORF Transcript_4767/g.9991 Transcript_4767/m.9991 type:complete len:81 (+) Transcript_4767:1135-1377(+)
MLPATCRVTSPTQLARPVRDGRRSSAMRAASSLFSLVCIPTWLADSKILTAVFELSTSSLCLAVYVYMCVYVYVYVYVYT